MPNPALFLGKIVYSGKSRQVPASIKKILFFKIGALGDIIMTTPLVRAIRKKFPDAIIDYACGQSYSEALLGNKYINYVIEFDEDIFYKKKYKDMKELAQRLRENKYDIIFVLDKHWAEGAFASYAGKFRIGFDRFGEGFANNLNINYTQNKHDILSYLDLGIYVRAKNDGTKPDIFISRKDRLLAKKICGKKCIAVAPGGGTNPGQNAYAKVWPKARFLEVINILSKKYRIVLIGGKCDTLICSWISKRALHKGNIKNMCAKTSVAESAAICEESAIILCNDSGAMHIASCVSDKIISLFGPTDPKVLAPMPAKSMHIWKEKSPCYDIFGNFIACKKGMMEKITAEDVINAARKYAKF